MFSYIYLCECIMIKGELTLDRFPLVKDQDADDGEGSSGQEVGFTPLMCHYIHIKTNRNRKWQKKKDIKWSKSKKEVKNVWACEMWTNKNTKFLYDIWKIMEQTKQQTKCDHK